MLNVRRDRAAEIRRHDENAERSRRSDREERTGRHLEQSDDRDPRPRESPSVELRNDRRQVRELCRARQDEHGRCNSYYDDAGQAPGATDVRLRHGEPPRTVTRSALTMIAAAV